MRRSALVAVIGLALAGCHDTKTPATKPLPRTPREANASPAVEAELRAVAQAFLDAIARGDGEAACRMLSPAAMKEGDPLKVKDGDYDSIAECAPDFSNMRELGRSRIVKIEMLSPFEGSRQAPAAG